MSEEQIATIVVVINAVAFLIGHLRLTKNNQQFLTVSKVVCKGINTALSDNKPQKLRSGYELGLYNDDDCTDLKWSGLIDSCKLRSLGEKHGKLQYNRTIINS